jgi:hypothetical protein
MATVKMLVISPLKFRGEIHKPGTELECSTAEARELLALGAVADPAAPDQSPQPTTPAKTAPAQGTRSRRKKTG